MRRIFQTVGWSLRVKNSITTFAATNKAQFSTRLLQGHPIIKRENIGNNNTVNYIVQPSLYSAHYSKKGL